MAELICDFCSGTPIRWRYPARTFKRNFTLATVNVDATSHGDWAACATCHLLIQKADRVALHERSFASFPIPVSEIPPSIAEQVKQEIRAVQDTFWSAREGAPAPIPIGDTS